MNALEKFDSVAQACMNTYGPSDPNYNKVQEMFHEFKKVAKVLFSLATYMKSQKKLCPYEMENRVLDFVIAFETTFPDVACFNKLHFIMMHVPECV